MIDARLTITLMWHACRNDVILAEACRNDVEAYCKDVEPGREEAGEEVVGVGRDGKTGREEGLVLRYGNFGARFALRWLCPNTYSPCKSAALHAWVAACDFHWLLVASIGCL